MIFDSRTLTMDKLRCVYLLLLIIYAAKSNLVVNYNSQCGQNQHTDDDAEIVVVKNRDKEWKSLETRVQALEDRSVSILDNLDRYGLKNYKYPGGWELIFRAKAGNGQNVLSSWRGDGTCFKENGCYQDSISPFNLAMDTQTKHIRSLIIDIWASSNIEQVKFSLYKGDSEVAYLTFNATGSTNENWMNITRLLQSSYRDVLRSSTYNVFSMQGLDNGDRTFYVNQKWGGCPNDHGWFFVAERYHVCNFDVFPTYPQFLYAPNNEVTQFALFNFELADFLMIFVKRN